MGNTNTGNKRHNSGEESGGSSGVYFDHEEPITGQKHPRLICQPSLDESDEFLSGSLRSALHDPGFDPISRLRADSLSGPPRCVKLPTVFKWHGQEAKEVSLYGSFDNWNKKIPLSKSDSQGEFYTIVELPTGEHHYKYNVDGEWRVDPKEPAVDNKLGTKNNIIKVKRSDFEVFEALKADSVNTGEDKKEALSRSPPGDYTQDIPVRKPGEKVVNPPVLPPHLLQVILNKDVPISCEPTLLPEPNHVMLNHLYALSIKDGVMVLSATNRYRKKFVTTLLYKPITT